MTAGVRRRSVPHMSGRGVAQQRKVHGVVRGYMAGPTASPFPTFGNKRAAASHIWRRFGRLGSYIEPFAGTASVAILSPYGAVRHEVLNDLNGYICNFFRSLRDYPARTAAAADRPTSQIDLSAAAAELVDAAPMLVERMHADLSFCEPRLAGLWVWLVCCSIDMGRHLPPTPAPPDALAELPVDGYSKPGDAARDYTPARVGCGGDRLLAWFASLSERLRQAFIINTDWSRMFSPSMLGRPLHDDPVGIFLDPPYDGSEHLYPGAQPVARDVCAKAVELGEQDDVRVCIAGYADDYDLPAGWTSVEWQRRPGMEATAGDYEYSDANAERQEVLMFSPGCIQQEQGRLV